MLPTTTDAPPAPDGVPASGERPTSWVGSCAFWVFAVVLPLATIASELVLGWSAEVLFDPLPTAGHILLCLLVPTAHAYAWTALQARRAPGTLALAANGVATGVSAFYALLYLPFTPFALLALAFAGLGILPLTPLVSLWIAVRLRRRLRRRGRDAGIATGRPFWLAGVGAILALLALDAPLTVTRFTAARVVHGSEDERREALTLLRWLGSESPILRMCHSASPGIDVVGALFAKRVSARQAREVFFRMTGRSYTSVPPSELGAFHRGVRIRGIAWQEGGGPVGPTEEGLLLASSRIDGSIDADAALAYLEWTLELRNDTARPLEARALLDLPPGAVVSRLTLWIDGEEREAAFAGRAATRQAYQAVVRRRRDPVLVTTAGPDRVLVQCFPVPEQGGLLKTRIGLSVPLELPALDAGRLSLPRIAERNFSIAAAMRHSVWIEGSGALSGAGLSPEQRPDGTAALRGLLTDTEIRGPGAGVSVARSATAREAWAVDRRGNDSPAVVQQVIREREREAVPVVVVIDGSRAMGPEQDAVARALTRAPAGSVAAVLVAGEEVQRLSVSRAPGESWADRLASVHFVGGQDNLPALEAAWDEAAGVGGLVLWVHGPQPVLLGSIDGLRQRWERRPDGPMLIALGLAPGPNRVLEGLEGLGRARAFPRERSLEKDLTRLLLRWGTRQREVEVLRERPVAASPDSRRGGRTSDHLVRLWAHEEILRLLPTPPGREAALDLATRYHLVTPVSGAVVLETAEQFEEAGLAAVAPSEVPTIPEPETWALIALALLAVLVFWRSRRHACAA